MDTLEADMRADLVRCAEQLIENMHVCDTEALEIANRISGLKGEPPRHPDVVQVMEDAETLIRASLMYLLE